MRCQCSFNRVHDIADGQGFETQPESRGRVGSVALALVAGELRRQPHRNHPLCAQGIDGDDGGEGGVDAARQAEQDAGKPVLVHVVAESGHQRVVRIRRLGGRRRRRSGAAGPFVVHARPLRYHAGFLPERKASDQRSSRAHHERSAVEHQLVLSTDLIHVHQRQAGFGGAPGGECRPLPELSALEGRSVRDDQQTGTLIVKMPRDGREPHVFTDHDAETGATKLHDIRQRAGNEHTLLVEYTVVRELVFVPDGGNAAIGQQQAGVVGHSR